MSKNSGVINFLLGSPSTLPCTQHPIFGSLQQMREKITRQNCFTELRYVQWMFPTATASQSIRQNPNPVLTANDVEAVEIEIKAFREIPDPGVLYTAVQYELIENLRTMLSFWGMELHYNRTASNPHQRAEIHQNPETFVEYSTKLFDPKEISEHAKISRIFESLSLFGLKDYAATLYHFLVSANQTSAQKIPEETFTYWEVTTFSEEELAQSMPALTGSLPIVGSPTSAEYSKLRNFINNTLLQLDYETHAEIRTRLLHIRHLLLDDAFSSSLKVVMREMEKLGTVRTAPSSVAATIHLAGTMSPASTPSLLEQFDQAFSAEMSAYGMSYSL